MKTVSFEKQKACLYTHVTRSGYAAITEEAIQAVKAPITILVADHIKHVEAWADDVALFHHILRPDDETYDIQFLYPTEEGGSEENSELFDYYCKNLEALTALRHKRKKPLLIFTAPDGLFQKFPSPDVLAVQEIALQVGDAYGFDKLKEELAGVLHYDTEALCERPGQFAVRGGLIDVYPLNANAPYRIDFFGDEIESIRTFDPTTQRSLDEANTLRIGSAPTDANSQTAPITEFLGKEAVHWILQDPEKIKQDHKAYFQYSDRIQNKELSFQDIFESRKEITDSWSGITDIELDNSLFGPNTKRRGMHTESLDVHRAVVNPSAVGQDRFEQETRARKQFLQKCVAWQEAGIEIHIILHNTGEEERLREILKEEGFSEALKPMYHIGDLSTGFLLLDTSTLDWETDKEGIAFIASGEIFGRSKQRVRHINRKLLPSKAQVDQLLDFSELADGDYVVHLQHGICMFRGIQKMDVGGKTEEVISLEFDGSMTLHVKLHDSHLLSRYVGLSKKIPKLNKLGSGAWDKTRRAAERATLDLAGELLSMQAKRDHDEGHIFAADNHWQKEFESSFIFKETHDQLRAIQETKGDMESTKSMDRLVCGDVGFGKTEVAIRAAFKAVMDGKQVAMLVPTTILCQQHFTTFKERMAEYPIVVEMLSRFRTPTQKNKILTGLKTGSIDIIVGTHSLLSSKVDYARLGLLIIDEEHRFGVRQKEKIKRVKSNVDVLSMSATPIPRTLHMALVGARDLSLIETAPRNRLPVQTFVKRYNKDLVKQAIQFEVERGGQVFYLHNRVQTIYGVANTLQDMMPDLRIAVGHGQMEERELEKIMSDFVANRYDVLVSTTIIESGLDIPNANTMIIDSADTFGLSQLYQIRGRVGRFNRQAYAYLLLHKDTEIIDDAKKRLGTLKEYNQLGAGFKIAMRDLELRGAGNLLGAQQSGHIAGIGFDLYCQLLRQSVSRIKGEVAATHIRAQIKLDFVLMGIYGDSTNKGSEDHAHFSCPRIEACIPPSYIGEATLRIDIYRKFSTAENLEAIEALRQDIVDRFGKYPESVDALIRVAEIRCLAEEKGVMSVEAEENKLRCQWAKPEKSRFLKIGNRFPLLTKTDPRLRLKEIKDFLKYQVHLCTS